MLWLTKSVRDEFVELDTEDENFRWAHWYFFAPQSALAHWYLFAQPAQ